MPTLFRANKRYIFVLYTFIITTMGCYALFTWQKKQQQYAQYDVLVRTSLAINNALDHQQISYLSELERTSDAYDCAHNKMLKNQGIHIQKSEATIRQTIDQELTTAYKGQYRPGSYITSFKGVLDSDQQRRAYFAQNRILGDNLRQFAQKSTRTIAGLDTIFAPSRQRNTELILKDGRDDQKVALLSALRLNHRSAACQTLAFLKNGLQNIDKYVYEGIIPMISYKKQCVHAGETFFGEAYVLTYHSNPHNITAFINNQSIPITLGLARFQKQYRTPGEKILAGKILVRNPLTGGEKTFTKQFAIQICE